MQKRTVMTSFSTLPAMKKALEEALCEVKRELHLCEEVYYDLKVILHELSCNALEHGVSPVEVMISTCCDGKHLHALICDKGDGFDPCVLAKRIPPNQERGRGIYLVEQLADGLSYNNAANKVLVRLSMEPRMAEVNSL